MKSETTISFNEPEDAKIVEDAELYKEFISESCEHLQDTEANILSLEDNPEDLETLNSIFRCVHSIKGSAGFLGLEKIQKLSHELETVLDKARKGEMVITQATTDVLLNSIDTLGRLIDGLSSRVSRVADIECERLGKSDSGEDIEIESSLDDIRSILDSDKDGSNGTIEKAEENIEIESKPEDLRDQELQDRDLRDQELQDRDLQDQELQDQELQDRDLQDQEGEAGGKIGEILVKTGVVTQEQVDEAAIIKDKKIGEILVEDGVVTEKQVEDAAKKREKKIGEILVEKGVVDKKRIEDAVKKQGVQRQEAAKTTLKVDTVKLDSLFDLVGELVVTHSLINEEFGNSQAQNSGTNQNLSQLGKIVKDLQDQSMSLRMLPLKQTFQKMSRLVRDIASNSGKSVKLEVSGEDTELDKNVIEKIADPLVHILRNSVDHGIETVEDRIRLNKPKEGHVHLNAFHRGGNIVIEIKDDGKGLSRDRILKKAMEKGIINDPSSLNNEQVFNLIFAPGFSTAEKITNVSGRGVGMDVVKRNIDSLHGNVDIASEEGEGSTFTIKLPLTLAIIDGIVVKVGNTRYIIPIISVEESIRPEKEMLSTIRKQEEILNIRGEVIPLVRLHNLFRLSTGNENLWDSIVVIVQSENNKFGIMADELVGQQQAVIKSLGKRFKNCKGVSGAAIMGNGEVGLIMDINGIGELAFNN